MMVWAIVLAFFGLNVALAGWLVVRFTAGPVWAMATFNLILIMTIYGILQIVAV